MRLLSRLWRSGVVGSFFAGLAVLAPLILTLIILQWLMARLAAAFGPGTVAGDLLSRIGTGLVGANHGVIAYLLGLGLLILGVWALGVFVRGRAKQGFVALVDRLLSAVPVLRTVYRPVSRVFRLMAGSDGSDLRRMQVVTVRFGGAGGADVLALQTSSRQFEMDGEARLLIYLPTSPLPMSGGLVFVPRANVTPQPDLNVDDLLRIYVSLGSLVPDASDAFAGSKASGRSIAPDPVADTPRETM